MSVDVPATIWRVTSGNYDSTPDGPNDIADPSGVLLVDPSGVQIIDTGLEMPIIPDTEWSQDDSR